MLSSAVLPDKPNRFKVSEDAVDEFNEGEELVTVAGGPTGNDDAALLAYSTLMAQWLATPRSRIISFVRHSSCSPEQALAMDRHIHWFEWEFNCFVRNRRGIIKTVNAIINKLVEQAADADEELEELQLPAIQQEPAPEGEDPEGAAEEEEEAEAEEAEAEAETTEPEVQQPVRTHRSEVETALHLAKAYNVALARMRELEERPIHDLPKDLVVKLQEEWETQEERGKECDVAASRLSDRARMVYGNAKYLAWVENTILDDLKRGLPVDEYDVTEVKELLRADPKLKLDDVADQLPLSWQKAYQIHEMSLSSGHESRNVGLQALTQGQGYIPEPRSNKGWSRIFGKRPNVQRPPHGNNNNNNQNNTLRRE